MSIIDGLSSTYLQNYIKSYDAKTEKAENEEDVTNAKEAEKSEEVPATTVNTKKTTTDVWKEIVDSFSKSSSMSDLYLNYGNVMKASDIIGDNLDTTLLNTRKLIYGTQGALIDSVSSKRKSFGGTESNKNNGMDDAIEKMKKIEL